ncbi:hypothetical protein EBZ70_10985 [bacterium]|nr:hypothetical protein [bacterium]
MEENITLPEVDESDSPSAFAAAAAAREAARLASRPNIDHLPDAIAKDEMGVWQLLARPGEKVIIERFSSILDGSPWMDTKTFVVDSIDGATGNIYLHDIELCRQSMTNIPTALKYGHRFKLPTARMPDLTSKRKRGRPKKVVTLADPPPAAATSGEPTAPKKRGRPKGSKNRPSDVVAAERAAKKDAKKRVKSRG